MTSDQTPPTTPLPAAVAALADELFNRRPDLASARPGLIDAYLALVETFNSAGVLYICGNGGSFADALHIKGELAKGFRKSRPLSDPVLTERLNQTPLGTQLLDNLQSGLPVIVLGESHSLRSAYANDRDPDLTYAQELHSFAAHLKTGALLAISTSGTATNVIAAACLAQAYGLTTIAFTGSTGGPLAQIANIDWRVPGAGTPAIQENQLPLYHALCAMLEAYFFDDPDSA